MPNNIKWENEDKLHITVKFLGDVGENLTELIIDRLENLVFNPFEAEFSKFSFFSKNRERKILYAGFNENTNFNNFHKLIEDECELLGFNRENRKFLPHLTLLRIRDKNNQKIFEKFNITDIKINKFTIDSFSLLKSELKPTGSEYTLIKSFKMI